MSSRSRNLCPPEFNFLCGVICFYQLGTILWPPNNESCHGGQTPGVFDGDHLVTTGTVAHIYHLIRERRRGGGGGKKKKRKGERFEGSRSLRAASRYGNSHL